MHAAQEAFDREKQQALQEFEVCWCSILQSLCTLEYTEQEAGTQGWPDDGPTRKEENLWKSSCINGDNNRSTYELFTTVYTSTVTCSLFLLGSLHQVHYILCQKSSMFNQMALNKNFHELLDTYWMFFFFTWSTLIKKSIPVHSNHTSFKHFLCMYYFARAYTIVYMFHFIVDLFEPKMTRTLRRRRLEPIPAQDKRRKASPHILPNIFKKQNQRVIYTDFFLGGGESMCDTCRSTLN